MTTKRTEKARAVGHDCAALADNLAARIRALTEEKGHLVAAVEALTARAEKAEAEWDCYARQLRALMSVLTSTHEAAGRAIEEGNAARAEVKKLKGRDGFYLAT